MTFVAYTLVSAGLFFMVVSAIGLVQLPGLYTRAHAVAKSETLGLLLLLVGLLFHPDHTVGSSARLVFILVFSMIANPTAVHALLRAARRSGVQPWRLHEPEPTREDEA
jgi:multicomponent Na+:H+ antiporter subunit G